MPTRRLIFTPLAGREVRDAIAWYETRSRRTSDRFAAEIERLTSEITANPYQYAALVRDARRAVLIGFPYILVYRTSEEAVQVLACFHTSRNPRALFRRL